MMNDSYNGFKHGRRRNEIQDKRRQTNKGDNSRTMGQGGGLQAHTLPQTVMQKHLAPSPGQNGQRACFTSGSTGQDRHSMRVEPKCYELTKTKRTNSTQTACAD